MLDIYVLDDEDAFRESLCNKINAEIAFGERNMQIAYDTGNPHVFLDKLKDNKNKNIYFLDVDLKTDIDGLKVAAEIRKNDTLGYIIFVTADAESYKRTFEYAVQAFNYIEKNVANNIELAIKTTLDNIEAYAIKQNEPQSNMFSFISLRKKYYINKSDIVSVEVLNSAKKRLIISTYQEYHEFTDSLSHVLEELNSEVVGDIPQFVKVHQSRILNLDYIKSFDALLGTVEITNGTKIKASRRRINVIKKYKRQK